MEKTHKNRESRVSILFIYERASTLLH